MPNETLEIKLNGATGEIVGPLNRNTVAKLDKNYHVKIIKQLANEAALDLAQTTSVDTAGLAWLLLLLEIANEKNCQLAFANLPDDLLKLAKLSAVDTFLIPTT